VNPVARGVPFGSRSPRKRGPYCAPLHTLAARPNLRLHDCLDMPHVVPSEEYGVRHLLELATRGRYRRIAPVVEADSFEMMREYVLYEQVVSFQIPIGLPAADLRMWSAPSQSAMSAPASSSSARCEGAPCRSPPPNSPCDSPRLSRNSDPAEALWLQRLVARARARAGWMSRHSAEEWSPPRTRRPGRARRRPLRSCRFPTWH
jgi:hypothetical protein